MLQRSGVRCAALTASGFFSLPLWSRVAIGVVVLSLAAGAGAFLQSRRRNEHRLTKAPEPPLQLRVCEQSPAQLRELVERNAGQLRLWTVGLLPQGLAATGQAKDGRVISLFCATPLETCVSTTVTRNSPPALGQGFDAGEVPWEQLAAHCSDAERRFATEGELRGSVDNVFFASEKSPSWTIAVSDGRATSQYCYDTARNQYGCEP